MSRAKYYSNLYAKLGVRSKLELGIRAELEASNYKFGYETEVIKYTPPPKERKYTPDFIFDKKEGGKLHIEVKGYFKSEDRMKHLHVKACNPDLDIRFVLQTPTTKIRKGSKTTYAMWLEKNGFRWAKKEIPQHWLDECDLGDTDDLSNFKRGLKK